MPKQGRIKRQRLPSQNFLSFSISPIKITIRRYKIKTVKDKYLVVGADFAGFPLKEAVVAHLEAKGWKITDLGVTKDSDPNDTENMFHRVGLRVGAEISEGNFERALLFCGTGMGIHIAASKCPHVHAGVVESVPAALRAIQVTA